MSPEIKKLLDIIELKLDWGNSELWQSRDFENLNQLILDETGVSLSASTLRRIWGHVAYKHLPSTTTLDALAKFAGFENWRNFTKKNILTEVASTKVTGNIPAPPTKTRRLRNISWIVIILVIASLISIFAVKRSKAPINANQYSLSFKRVSNNVPNSVIFTYDAAASPTDSVYIQQSWDPSKRVRVDKSLHKHTSIYYDPGFHRAKLIIGDSIVKEQKLIIPTNGWLGMINHQPVPVYLKADEFSNKNYLEVPLSVIQKKNIALDPQPPVVRFFNVGNFNAVPVKDFSFDALIKNEYSEGAAACQMSFIFLITDDGPIMIPTSSKGCVSDLNIYAIDTAISGKKTDLSGFGVDFSDWVHVSCKTADGKLQFLINGKSAYELPATKKDVNIVGLNFVFVGTGAVKNISLRDKEKLVFSAF